MLLVAGYATRAVVSGVFSLLRPSKPSGLLKDNTDLKPNFSRPGSSAAGGVANGAGGGGSEPPLSVAEAAAAELQRRMRERLAEHHRLSAAAARKADAKEALRARIRDQLHERLSKSLCGRERSLPNLLRMLGVIGKSAPPPSPEQRSKALKAARVRFHPDKAKNLEASVYAEEVSKLLNSGDWA